MCIREVEMMERKTVFILTEAVLMLGFAYAVQNYDTPAVLCGVWALVLTGGVSLQTLKKLLPQILAIALAGLAAVRLSGLHEILPSLGAVSVCSACCAVILMQKSADCFEEGGRAMALTALCFYAGVMILPDAAFGFLQMMTIVTLIFMPSLVCMAMKTLREEHGEKVVEGQMSALK